MKISNNKKNSKSYSVFVLAIIILSGIILIVKSENVYAQSDCDIYPDQPGCPGYQDPCGDYECNRGIEDNPSSRLYCPSDCCDPPKQWSFNRRRCEDSCGSQAGPAYSSTNPTGTGLCASTYGECLSAFPNGFQPYDSYDCTVCCKKIGTAPTELCGNRNIDTGEECDNENLGSPPATCQSKGFSGGTIACYQQSAGANACKFDTSGCTGATTTTGTGCGERGWRDPTFWGGCGDCTGCGSAGCGEALAFCDGTNWNTNWDPLVTEGQRSTATSGHICPCRTGTGVLCPPTNPPINYGPYSGNSPSDFTSEKQKAWRISMCFPPSKDSMPDWISAYQSTFGTSLRRFSPTSDKVIFPQTGCVDLIQSSSIWAWQPTNNFDCSTTPSGDCSVGPYVSLLSGWDLNKLNDCSKQSPKYKAGRVFTYFSPPKITDEVIKKLNDAGLHVSQVSGSKDKINFDVEYEPGKKVGVVDVIRSVRDDGSGQAWTWTPTTDGGGPGGDGVPEIISVEPTTLKVGETLTIKGKELTSTVQFIAANHQIFTVAGVTTGERTMTQVTIPSELIPGVYNVRIYKTADKISNTKTITVIRSGSTIKKLTPDEDAEGYCIEDPQCLVNPFGKDGTTECINSGEYFEDNYCDNGLWTTRTKLLALKLLKLKSGDYTLFCDNKENTLINLQYQIDSGELVADIVEKVQTNNFCILKTKDNIIASASINNKDDVNDLFTVLGVANCNNARDDGNYYACDNSNKVWYNRKLNTFIYSSNSVRITQDVESSSTLVNIFKAIVEAIKRLIIRTPVDETYLNGIKKFRNLYMLEQGGKSIRGTIDGKSLRNMAIEYNNIDVDICKFVDEFNELKKPESSGITCKKEGKKYYVLAQGNAGTSLDPDSIWLDMTSKLRLK